MNSSLPSSNPLLIFYSGHVDSSWLFNLVAYKDHHAVKEARNSREYIEKQAYLWYDLSNLICAQRNEASVYQSDRWEVSYAGKLRQAVESHEEEQNEEK